MKTNYKHTIAACFLGYISQSVINSFAPLLFLTFQSQYGVGLGEIALITTVNFGVQLLTDLFASRFVQKIGYRPCIVAAQLLCAAGLSLMALLPDIIGSPLLGLMLAVTVYAVGGGLLEVLVSPIVEACPTKNKAGIMSLMHSFYCWGVVLTVLLSTGFFAAFGIENWKTLAYLWALLPLIGAALFTRVPLYPVEGDGDKPNYKSLFKQRAFWLMLLLMVCAGASEQAVSQWASAFAEMGLSVSKTTGDLLGVCGFSVLMGLSRTIYAKYSERLPLKRAMLYSGVLCVISYLLIGLSDSPVLGLIGCALCGFSVGVFWPGTFSLSTRRVHMGGTTMFALLALAGDVGCAAGPTIVGFITGAAGNDLRVGILAAAVFPVALLVALIGMRRAE